MLFKQHKKRERLNQLIDMIGWAEIVYKNHESTPPPHAATDC